MEDIHDLMIRIKLGDVTAFKVLYDSLKNDIYSYAYRFFRSSELAEEAVQNVFMQVWKHRDTIDPDRAVKAYIYRIARNCIYNQLKREVHREDYETEVFCRSSNLHNEVEEAIAYKDLVRVYEQAISKLPAQRQLIFKMSRTDFRSHEEIAEHLAISKNTVKDQIVKALRFIKQYLSAHTEINR